MKPAKNKRVAAERAAEWYLRKMCGVTKTVRAMKTQWQRQDLFACDCIGRTPQGTIFYVQVTCGVGEVVRERRRKLEQFAWNEHEVVMILQLVARENPANATKVDLFFRVHRYNHRTSRNWSVDDIALPVPPEWFTKWEEGK